MCVFSCVRGCACWAPSKNQVIRRAKLLVLVGYWCCVVGEGDTSPCGGKILDSRFSVLHSNLLQSPSPENRDKTEDTRAYVRLCECLICEGVCACAAVKWQIMNKM